MSSWTWFHRFHSYEKLPTYGPIRRTAGAPRTIGRRSATCTAGQPSGFDFRLRRRVVDERQVALAVGTADHVAADRVSSIEPPDTAQTNGRRPIRGKQRQARARLRSRAASAQSGMLNGSSTRAAAFPHRRRRTMSSAFSSTSRAAAHPRGHSGNTEECGFEQHVGKALDRDGSTNRSKPAITRALDRFAEQRHGSRRMASIRACKVAAQRTVTNDHQVGGPELRHQPPGVEQPGMILFRARAGQRCRPVARERGAPARSAVPRGRAGDRDRGPSSDRPFGTTAMRVSRRRAPIRHDRRPTMRSVDRDHIRRWRQSVSARRNHG